MHISLAPSTLSRQRLPETNSRTPRRLVALAGALGFVLSSCQRAPSAAELASPPTNEGRSVADQALIALLTPDVPTERAALLEGPSGSAWFEALLAAEPPTSYVDQYLSTIRQRGVESEPLMSSPHAIPPRILGYRLHAVLPAGVRPFSLAFTSFENRDDDWLEAHPLRNAPYPITVHGRTLRVMLGKRLNAWRQEVLVPTADIEVVEELPFARFPGAVLKRVSGPTTDAGHIRDASVTRAYVIVGATHEDVLRHYASTLAPIGAERSRDGVYWSGHLAGMTRLSVSSEATPLAISGVPLDAIFKRAPFLLASAPQGVAGFLVHAEFESVATAARYWPAEQRKRRAQLLNEVAR